MNGYIDQDECYARVDNDTFVLLLYYDDIDFLQMRLSSLLQKVERIHVMSDNEIQLITIMGVYLIENIHESFSEMMDYANMARKSIKDSHHSCLAFFNDQFKVFNIKSNQCFIFMIIDDFFSCNLSKLMHIPCMC